MRRLFLIAAFAAGLLAPALAADDVMAGYYGNTVISTTTFGESHTHYKPDHTFDVAVGGFTGKGTWEVKDGNLCRTYETPPPGLPNPFCLPVAAHQPGDSWTVTVMGHDVPATMKAGIQ